MKVGGEWGGGGPAHAMAQHWSLHLGTGPEGVSKKTLSLASRPTPISIFKILEDGILTLLQVLSGIQKYTFKSNPH